MFSPTVVPALSLPVTELDRLLNDFQEALDLAGTGCAAEGFLRLSHGRDRAMQLAELGFIWAEELSMRYEGAVEAFQRRYAVRVIRN